MLDERLSLAAALYEPCVLGADIGTDHGLLPCHLLKENICQRMIFADVSAKALLHAQAQVKHQRLSDRARLICADGLDALVEKCGCVSVMGMGGETIASILTRGKDKLQGAILVLSAHTDLHLVRQAVQDIGYRIVREELCRAAGRFYVVWRAEPGAVTLTDEEIRFGPLLMQHMTPLLREYITWRMAVLRERLNGLLSAREPNETAIAAIRSDIAYYQAKLEECPVTVQQVYDFINARAPYEIQDTFDNSGLLVGDPTAEVHGVLFAMDLTQRVIDEAISAGADLIVTHHPIMFSPIKRLVATDYESRLIMQLVRHGIAMISAHTNLDKAPGGIDDVLAERLGLTNITGEDYVRIGTLPHPMNANELTAHVSHALNTVVRPMGSGENITRVAVCSGAGGSEWPVAHGWGAQAFISGEIKHHDALAAVDAGLFCLEAGHHATEEPGIFALADALQNEMNRVQYKVTVSKSQAGAYAMPERP